MLPGIQIQPAVPGTQHRGPKCTGPPAFRMGKDSDAGRDCRQEEKGMTEDEMAGLQQSQVYIIILIILEL